MKILAGIGMSLYLGLTLFGLYQYKAHNRSWGVKLVVWMSGLALLVGISARIQFWPLVLSVALPGSLAYFVLVSSRQEWQVAKKPVLWIVGGFLISVALDAGFVLLVVTLEANPLLLKPILWLACWRHALQGILYRPAATALILHGGALAYTLWRYRSLRWYPQKLLLLVCWSLFVPALAAAHLMAVGMLILSRLAT